MIVYLDGLTIVKKIKSKNGPAAYRVQRMREDAPRYRMRDSLSHAWTAMEFDMYGPDEITVSELPGGLASVEMKPGEIKHGSDGFSGRVS